MKKLHIYALSLFILLLTGSACFGEIEYSSYSCDLFSVRFDRPKNWTLEVAPTFIQFTNPDMKDVKLVFFEDDTFDGNLDDYYNQIYRENLMKEPGVKIKSEKSLEIDGMGCYYVAVSKADKSAIHVIFLKNGHPCFLILKAPADKAGRFEPVLRRAMDSLRFYKPRV